MSNREASVLRLIVQGRSSKEIAYLLSVSVKTVERDRAGLLKQANAHNTAQLVHWSDSL